MPALELQFSLSDITDKFRELHELAQISVDSSIPSLFEIQMHSIHAPLTGVSTYLYLIKEMALTSHELNKTQIEYLSNLIRNIKNLKDIYYNMFGLLCQKSFPEEEITQLAQEYYTLIQDFLSHLPTSNNLSSAFLNDTVNNIILSDIYSQIFVCNLNKLFSRKPCSQFLLRNDIYDFYNSNSNMIAQAEILLTLPKLNCVVTPKDYLTNAIIPLIFNAIDHAFNYSKKEQLKSIKITGRLNDNRSQYIITVQDNGKGIVPEVLPRIFEKGFSTKQDKFTPHGIELYGVKNFVEENNGELSVESKLGEGTKFTITIPYTNQ